MPLRPPTHDQPRQCTESNRQPERTHPGALVWNGLFTFGRNRPLVNVISQLVVGLPAAASSASSRGSRKSNRGEPMRRTGRRLQRRRGPRPDPQPQHPRLGPTAPSCHPTVRGGWLPSPTPHGVATTAADFRLCAAQAPANGTHCRRAAARRASRHHAHRQRQRRATNPTARPAAASHAPPVTSCTPSYAQ